MASASKETLVIQNHFVANDRLGFLTRSLLH